jgi:hypothetical protein
MITGTKAHHETESPIFQDVTLYKVIETSKGKPVALHYDGSASMIIEFEGVNNTSFSEDDFVSMFKRIQATFDDLRNPQLSIQFIMVRDNNIQNIDKNIKVLPSFLKPRAEFLKTLASDYKLFVNRFYLAIYCAADKPRKKDQVKEWLDKWFQKDGWKVKQTDKAMQNLNDRVASILEIGDLLFQMLNDIGSTAKFLFHKDEYYRLWQQFTRPGKFKQTAEVPDPTSPDGSKTVSGSIEIDDSHESPRRALFSGVRAEVNKDHFILDNYYHKVWTLDRAPRDVIFGKSIDVIESVPCEFIYSLTFRPLVHDEAMNVFKMKLAEKRIASGGNADAIIEDRSLTAEENRVSQGYDEFVYGDAMGAYVSANFCMRVDMEVLKRMAKTQRLSLEETMTRLDQSIMKKIFSRFGFSEWVNEENTQWPVFCQMIPGMSNIKANLMKVLFLSMADIPYFLAIYENVRKLEHNGTNHFIDVRGNMVVFDLMDPSLPAWNYSVSGQTGSGKSVFMNTILDMQFADLVKTGLKPIVCILDVGGDRGSYQKFMTLIGGSEINLSGIIKPSIQMFELIPERSNPTPQKVEDVAKMIFNDQKKSNPKFDRKLSDIEMRVRVYYSEILRIGYNNMIEYDFQKLFVETFEFEESEGYRDLLKLIPGNCEPSSKDFNLIMGILEVMLSSNVKVVDGFKTFDHDEIAQMVMETYRQTEGRFPYLSDFLAMGESIEAKDEETRKLQQRFKTKITNWTRKGENPMFDQDTTVDIHNDVILADLKGLESNPQLQVVYTLLISQLFNNKMYFTRNRRKFIVRDEAWSIMQNERARKFFVEDLRTARKNGFATISITQLPTDYLRPDESDGRAIISNMQVQIFCKFGTEKICQEVAHEFGLNNEVIEEMKTLGLQKELQQDGTYKNSYSKFMMVMGGKNIYIFYNILHPFEYQLYSSSADDNAVIDYYMKIKKSHNNLEDVLWMIARREHIGDQGLATFLETSGAKNLAKSVRGGK